MIVNDVRAAPSLTSGAIFAGSDRNIPAWLALLMTAFCVFYMWTGYEAYINYSWQGMSLGFYAQTLWNLGEGINFSSLANQAILPLNESLVSAPLALIYKLLPSPFILFILEITALTLGCGLIYKITSVFTNRTFAFVSAATYALLPVIASVASLRFFPMLLAIPILGWQILAFEKAKAKSFLIWGLLVLCIEPLLGCLALCFFIASLFRKKYYAIKGMALGLAAFGFACGLYKLKYMYIKPHIVIWILSATPIIFWGLGLLHKKIRGNAKQSRPRHYVISVVALLLFYSLNMSLNAFAFEYSAASATLPIRKSAVSWLMRQIPEAAPLVTTNVFLPRLANRKELYLVGDEETIYKEALQGDDDQLNHYALLDLSDYLISDKNSSTKEHRLMAEQIQALFEAKWYPIENVGSIVLFSSERDEAAILYKPVDVREDEPYLYLNAVASDDLSLVGLTMEPDEANKDIVRFMFYWQKIKESQSSYGMFFNIMSEDGEVVHTIKKPLCYQLYPFEKWELGALIKEQYAFVVPEELLNSSYEVHLGVYNLVSNRLERLQSPVRQAIDQWGLARLIALDAI
ncbi:MAG: hypothetical protein ACI9CF_000823 [Candidatus Omnitrophota bacterium]|jgi:uncharacterized membrane protein